MLKRKKTKMAKVTKKLYVNPFLFKSLSTKVFCLAAKNSKPRLENSQQPFKPLTIQDSY